MQITVKLSHIRVTRGLEKAKPVTPSFMVGACRAFQSYKYRRKSSMSRRFEPSCITSNLPRRRLQLRWSKQHRREEGENGVKERPVKGPDP
ncbi:hypothetical protein PIB30_041144 [Stylosanthes scabra]|uniref:Uncharacterized protein n=1 Tax=Stylosanthes scabra TaxID=79078 RepID=A0ABU6SG64_9FABA|nr:hypothetical protein [Stylosanthes scabra]